VSNTKPIYCCSSNEALHKYACCPKFRIFAIKISGMGVSGKNPKRLCFESEMGRSVFYLSENSNDGAVGVF
jgi:hypothetical protein